MNARNRLRNARYRRSAAFSRFVRSAGRLGGFHSVQGGGEIGLRRVPLGQPRADHHRLNEQHDLVAVGIVRAELRAFARIEPALEQRAEDRRIDLRPVEVRRRQYRLDVNGLQRERRTIVEQSAVEPGDRLEANPAAGGHHSEEFGGQLGELLRGALRLSQHPGEHVIGQQAHVVGEHAEDEPVDEVRDHGRIVTTRPQRLGDGREGRRRPLGEGAPGLARPQPLGIRKGPLQSVTDRAVGEVVEVEFIGSTDAVRPVGADAEPPQVGDDQQRRVLQRQRILPELGERRIKVGALALVLPGKAVALPDVGPAVAARVLAGAAFKAIRCARRVGLSRCRFVQEPTEVEEVLLRRRPLFQRGIAPLGDKGVRRHAEVLAWRSSRVWRLL